MNQVGNIAIAMSCIEHYYCIINSSKCKYFYFVIFLSIKQQWKYYPLIILVVVVLNLLNILFTDRGDNTQGKLDLPVVYSLHEELKKILRAYKKEKIPACSNCPEFHFAISCFRNYEVS